jgi:hypothetical protein
MNDDRFRVEEGAALVYAIFPNYPELHQIYPAPEVEPFLLTLRTGEPHRNAGRDNQMTQFSSGTLRLRTYPAWMCLPRCAALQQSASLDCLIVYRPS